MILNNLSDLKKYNEYFKFSISSNYFRIIVNILSTILFLPLLIKKLGLNQYGIYVFVYSFIYLSIFFDLGIGRYIVIKIASSYSIRFQNWFICLINFISLILGSLGMFFTLILLKLIDPNILHNLHIEERHTLYLLCSIIIFLSVINTFQRNILEGLQNFYINNFSIIFFNILNYSALFYLITYSSSISTIVSAPIFALIFNLIFQNYWIIKKTNLTHNNLFIPKKKEVEKLPALLFLLLKKSRNFIFQSILASALNPLFRFMSYGIASEIVLVSIIDISIRVGTIFASIINSISLPFFSYFAKLGRKNIHKISKISNFISLIGLLFLFIFALFFYFFPYREILFQKYLNINQEYLNGGLIIIFSLFVNSLFDSHLRAMIALRFINDIIIIRVLQYILFVALLLIYLYIYNDIIIFFLSFSIPIIFFGTYSFYKLNKFCS